jgi:hypothetical protein
MFVAAVNVAAEVRANIIVEVVAEVILMCGRRYATLF